ncbi:MAG: MFS transporter [Ktedonobacterales bacterium]|nr:MFS transporter [Ktedonobacterales bacterium]
MSISESLPSSRSPSVWHNRNFVLLWSGQVVSEVGSGVSQIAFPLLVLLLTRSPAQAGFMGATRLLPYLAFSLPAGALVDRWDRRRVMLLCDAGRALALGSVALAIATQHLSLGQLYLVSLAEGGCFVFYNLAQTACLPRVVTGQQFATAMAYNEAIFSIALLVGPSLGGVLWSAGHALPFTVDALSYAASVVSIFFIRVSFQGERSAPRRRLHHEIVEGMVWLWRQPVIRFTALLTGGFDFVIPGSTLILIVLAQRQHASPTAIGLMFASGGVGGLVGAFWAPRLRRRYRFGPLIVSSCWLYALGWPLFALAPNPLAIGMVLAAFTSVDVVYNLTQYTYRLSLIPDALQGRVNSVIRLFFFSLMTAGLALTGVLLERIGPMGTILLFTFGLVALAVVATLNPSIRQVPPPERARPERARAEGAGMVS